MTILLQKLYNSQFADLTYDDCFPAAGIRPNAPFRQITTRTQAQQKPLSMCREGNLLYVLYQQGSIIEIFDVKDCKSPISLASHNIGLGNPNGMVVKNGIAYLALTSLNTVRAVDLTAITSATLKPSFATNSGCFGMAIKDNYLYVAGSGSGGVAIHEISDPNNIPKVANTDNFGACGDVQIKGNYLFTSHYGSNAIRIYDITNPISPVFVLSHAVGNMPVWMTLDGNLLFASDYSSGNSFHIIDVTNPASPSTLADVNVGHHITGIRRLTVGSYDLIAVGGDQSSIARVKVYDIKTPSAPVLVESITGDGGSSTVGNKGLAIVSNCLYMGQHLVTTMRVHDLIWPGYMFFDMGLSPKRPIWWNAQAWVDSSGNAV